LAHTATEIVLEDVMWLTRQRGGLMAKNETSSRLLEVRTDEANEILCELCGEHRVLFVGRGSPQHFPVVPRLLHLLLPTPGWSATLT
jgi:hypothetical protein